MKASQHAACHERWSYHVPPEILIIRHVSDLLIVFNSSINFVVYCFVEQSFRQARGHSYDVCTIFGLGDPLAMAPSHKCYLSVKSATFGLLCFHFPVRTSIMDGPLLFCN